MDIDPDYEYKPSVLSPFPFFKQSPVKIQLVTDEDFVIKLEEVTVNKGEITNRKILNLDPKYIIINYIFSGSFGNVYRAYDTSNKKFVAIKLQKSTYDGLTLKDVRTTAETFKSEIKILKKLGKDHCDKFSCMLDYGTFENSDYYYIIMSLAEGIDLTDYIKNQKYSLKEIKTIINSLYESVVLIHSLGLSHNDLKPDNIKINPLNLKTTILDFGVSCFSPVCGNAGTPVYTPSYVNTDSSIEDRKSSDFWALLLILFQLTFKIAYLNNPIQTPEKLQEYINALFFIEGYPVTKDEYESNLAPIMNNLLKEYNPKLKKSKLFFKK
jgi:serine/threonine protein kinase